MQRQRTASARVAPPRRIERRVSSRPDDPGATSGPSPAGELAPTRSGVLVLSGYGLRVAVERGHLAVADGVGRERRGGRLARATCGLKRLVVLGHSGTVSLEALRWLHDVGATFVQVDADGEVLVAAAPPGLDDARLRRAQALAAWDGTGVAIARDLLRRKITGQAELLARLPYAGEAVEAIRRALEDLGRAETPERLRLAEAEAAAAYWGAWAEVPVRFARRDEPRVPAHWRTFGVRRSPLTGSPRSAANPANALLNYLYALLEAEARLAALAVGLDPGMGVLHADQRSRDSLACDLMEAVRPAVDGYVLDLLQTRAFTLRDFFETRQGGCRLLPPLTHLLAETAPAWARAVAPIAEWMAQTLHAASEVSVAASAPSGTLNAHTPAGTGRVDTSRSLPTPLSQANRSAGRNAVRRAPRRPTSVAVPSLPYACRGCGVLLDETDRRYCDACLPQRDTEQRADFTARGPEVLAQLRAQGADPAHGGAAERKRGERNARHQREIAAWEDAVETANMDLDFARDILPGLRQVSLDALMRTTGLSLRYCWLIRRGERVPHPRHWQSLLALRNARVPNEV